jgi:hypothetical protein
MDVVFSVGIKDRVKLPTGRRGTVEGLYVDDNKQQHVYVRYADSNGAVFRTYFPEEEVLLEEEADTAAANPPGVEPAEAAKS